MPTPGQNSGTLRFDLFTLDLRAGELHKSGRKIKLQEQPFLILVMLLEQPGQVVTREELRERLWPKDTFVDFDHSLNTAIKKLRQALNDEADKPRFIETLPRRGYRFVGPAVEKLAAPAPQSSGAPGTNQATSDTASKTAKDSHIPWPLLGLLALLVVALAAGAFFFLRRAPVLTEKDTIVLADFTNTTGDAVFDGTLRQGLAVQLAQSPFLGILSDEKVRDTLKLMGRAPGDRLTPDVARELCQRAGSKVYLSGSIASLGTQYVLGLNAVDCRTGDSIVQEQVQAARKEDVLKALGDATTKLRQKLGESLSSIEKYDTPLEQATTPSLEALRAFSLGNKTSGETSVVAAIPFFKQAIELDPSFALAHAVLGSEYIGLGEPGQAAENIEKAYSFRDRVSEPEKFYITSLFYSGVTGELEKSNQTCDLWARTYPRDYRPHLVLGLHYEFLGLYDKAVSEDREAIRLNPDVAIVYSNLMEAYTPLNRLQEAKATYRQAVEHRLDGPFLHADLYVVAFLENDAAEMQRQISLAGGMPGAEDWLFSLQSDTAAFSGHLATAQEFSRRAVESARRNDLNETAAMWRMNAALRDVEFGNADRARQEIREGLSLASTRDIQILAALALARAGDTARAQALADDLEKRFPANTILLNYWLPSIRAAIDLDRGHPAEAITILEAAGPYEMGYPQPQLEGGSLLYPVYLRGLAYLQSHQAEKAAAEFRKFLDSRAIVVNCPLAALAHLQLGRVYVLAGDSAEARRAYSDFLSLWKDADADIPALRQARSEFAGLPKP
jgi:DNA-binding winged helix-turn-helix (wHTH) protein/tetratricopeptide (TPR) repeat protein